MKPAAQLVGVELDGGWIVIGLNPRNPNATGGTFSVGYLVENRDGRKGFMKAMDYFDALKHRNTLEEMQRITREYLFEREMSEACRDQQMSRIAHALASGTYVADPANPLSKVEYLIFDRAEGDIRTHIDFSRALELAFALRLLHNAAVGINQLHLNEMAHQDLKPSNVLVFDKHRGSKLTDLGRSWAKAIPGPFDGLPYSGDRNYAPPEVSYGFSSPDERDRRFGCDVYQFGNLMCFLFTQTTMNALLVAQLPVALRPFVWRGSYADALPGLLTAFAAALSKIEPEIPAPVREEVLCMITQLCHPDIGQRGHPVSRRAGNQWGMERYVSALDLLARRAALLGPTHAKGTP